LLYYSRLFHDNIESFVVQNSYLRYLFETKINEMKQSGFKDDVILRNRCIQLLIKLIKKITQRLPDNVDVLKQISVFSVNNTLRVVKPDLFKILEHFHYNPDLIEKIHNQWKNITLTEWQNTASTDDFWSEVLSFKDSNGENPYQELALLALSFLVLPHSNAEVER
jgi:hypothetical protein